VAPPDAEPRERPRHPRRLVHELPVGVPAHLPGDRAVVDQRGLITAPVADGPVEHVEAQVEAAARKPAVERRAARIERGARLALPLHGGRKTEPERLRILLPPAVRLGVPNHVSTLPESGPLRPGLAAALAKRDARERLEHDPL